jgi:hypothetical protein
MPHDTTEPMKLFLVHATMFVASIWKNKSGWFLFVRSPGLSVATEIIFNPSFAENQRHMTPQSQ